MSLVSKLPNAIVETGYTDFGFLENCFYLNIVEPKGNSGTSTLRMPINIFNDIVLTHVSKLSSSEKLTLESSIPHGEHSEEICTHFAKYSLNKPLYLQTLDGDLVTFVINASTDEIEVSFDANGKQDSVQLNFELSDWHKLIRKYVMLNRIGLKE